MHDPGTNVVDSSGLVTAKAGYDHSLFKWNPMTKRAPLRWPGGAAVAVSVVIDLGAIEWERPERKSLVPPPGGRGVKPFPDVPRLAHREYGHRVGVFRVLRMLQALDVTPAAAVDVLTAERYQPLFSRIQGSVREIIAHGLSASRPITSEMAVDEECHYIDTTLDRLQAATGVRPAGWLGPEHSESTRTPELLSRAGLRYLADWGNDDQPYRMDGLDTDFWSFPLSWELSDVSAMYLRLVDPVAYGRSLRDAFDFLRKEGRHSGRVLTLHLHPWLAGQAFRIGDIEFALKYVLNSGDVWVATPGEIVEWAASQGSPS